MSIQELINEIRLRTGLALPVSKEFLLLTLQGIWDVLKDEGQIVLPGFGTFTRKDLPAKYRKSRFTGEYYYTEPKTAIKFKQKVKTHGKAPTEDEEKEPNRVIEILMQKTPMTQDNSRRFYWAMIDAIVFGVRRDGILKLSRYGHFKMSRVYRRRKRKINGPAPELNRKPKIVFIKRRQSPRKEK